MTMPFFAQESQQIDNITPYIPINAVYILDSARNYRSPETFHLDDNDCFIQINNGYCVLSYKVRGKIYFNAGKITHPNTYLIAGDTVNTFTILSDNKYSNTSIGTRTFIGIKEVNGNNPTLYLLNNRQQIEKTFVTHLITDEEFAQMKE